MRPNNCTSIKKAMRKACRCYCLKSIPFPPSLPPSLLWRICASRRASRPGQARRVRHCPSPINVTRAPCLCSACGRWHDGGSVMCTVLQYGEELEDRTVVGWWIEDGRKGRYEKIAVRRRAAERVRQVSARRERGKRGRGGGR